jgi:hypothetical protein
MYLCYCCKVVGILKGNVNLGNLLCGGGFVFVINQRRNFVAKVIPSIAMHIQNTFKRAGDSNLGSSDIRAETMPTAPCRQGKSVFTYWAPLEKTCMPTSVTGGRCYDHNFLLFFLIFGEKIGVFLKNQCYDHNFCKN